MMASTTDADGDPYHQFESDVQALLEQTRLSFTSYLRIRSLVPATSPELVSARQELSENLSALADDLSDLTAAAQAIEKDPYKFGLDVADVARRGRFVSEVAGELEDMKEEMAKAPPKIEVKASDAGGFVGDDDDPANDPVAQYEQEQQMQIMREQDQQLEGVSRTVGNLREAANAMGQELGEQTEMIEALTNDADRVEGKLKKGMKDLNTFIRKNEDTASNWCIGLLILALVILLFLVLIL